MRDVFRLYGQQPLGIRFFVRVRAMLCPLERIESLVPRRGRFLDVGCGHGLFSNLLALRGAERSVLGIDPSSAKIKVAGKAGAGLPNVEFMTGYLGDLDETGFDVVTILDVLYLLPPEQKKAVLAECYAKLRPGGMLLLKTNDRSPKWKYWVAYEQEVLMTRVGLTLSTHELYFYDAKQNRSLLEHTGFAVEFVDLNSFLPYPHVAFLCRKPEE